MKNRFHAFVKIKENVLQLSSVIMFNNYLLLTEKRLFIELYRVQAFRHS